MSETKKSLNENKKTKGKWKENFPKTIGMIFLPFYAFAFFYSLSLEDPFIVTGVWGIFAIASYYVGIYCENNKNNYFATFFDALSVAHSYFLFIYLFNVEEYNYANLFFVIISFVRVMFINRSSHVPQFIFFLVFGFNYYILNAQTQIPLSDLSFLNLGFSLFIIISMYVMKMSSEIAESTLDNLNLLMAFYFTIISSVITIEVFDGDLSNYSIVVLSIIAFVFNLMFKSKSFMGVASIGLGIWMTGTLLKIDLKNISDMNLSQYFDFNLNLDIFSNNINEKIIEVPVEKMVQEDSFVFKFSDVHPMVYLTPIIIVFLVFAIRYLLKFLDARKIKQEETAERNREIERLKSSVVTQKEEEQQEPEINTIEAVETKEEVKEKHPKEPVEVTGYYDPIKEKKLEEIKEKERLKLEAEKEKELEKIRIQEEKERIDKEKKEAEERRKAKEEKDFLNPFNILDDDEDDFL